MSVRQKLNANPAVVAVVVIVVVAGLLWFGYRQMSPSEGNGPSGAYYSSDDGKTFFSGDPKAFSPIDQGGQKAYRAYVYDCPDGKRFVGYMERYPDDIKAILDKAKINPEGVPVEDRGKLMRSSQSREMKKPGEAKWVPLPPMGVKVTCGDGSPAKFVQ